MVTQKVSIYNLKERCYLIDEDYFLDLTGRIIEERFQIRIQDDDLDVIIEFLNSIENIKYLDLSYNNITSSGFSLLSAYLSKNKNLIYLDLKYNNIDSIDNIAVDLSIFWSLKCLILSGNMLGCSPGISGIIQNNESLVQLELADTAQTMSTTLDILTNFIKEYRVENNRSSINIIDLSRILPSSRSYETIYMTHVMRFFEKVIPFHKFVKITLRQNCITDFDIEILLDALSRCTELEYLDLKCNLISSHGLELLSGVLPYMSLEHLNLSTNRIGSDGASALGRVWKETKIKYLDISENKIEDCGMINLFIGLKERSSPIVGFYIFGNPIRESAAKELYLRVYHGLVPRDSIDVHFDWDRDGNLLFLQETGRCEHLNRIAKELSAFKKLPKYLCCIPSQEETKKTTSEEKHKRLRKLFFYHVKFWENRNKSISLAYLASYLWNQTLPSCI